MPAERLFLPPARVHSSHAVSHAAAFGDDTAARFTAATYAHAAVVLNTDAATAGVGGWLASSAAARRPDSPASEVLLRYAIPSPLPPGPTVDARR